MPNPEPLTSLERYASVGAGGLLLLVAASLFGWGARLAVAGLRSPAGWPPGLEQLLLPIAITTLVVGFGAWRLLRIGLPERIFGLSSGRAVLATFGLAGVIGALA